MIETMRHFTDERLRDLAKVLGDEAAKLQSEAACKQRLADRVRKELKRRRREANQNSAKGEAA